LRKDFDKFKGENSQLYVRTKMNDKKMFKLYQDDLAKRLALHNDLEAIRNGELIMHNGELYINALKSAESMKLGAPSTPKKSVREKLTDLDTERNRKIAAGIVIGTVAVGATIVLAHNEKVRNAIDGARAELKEYVDEHLPSEIKEKAQAAKQAVIEKSKPIVAKATEAIVTHAPTMVSDRLAPKLQANTAHQVAEPEVEDTKTAHMKRKVTAIALAATQTASGRLARAGLVKAAELGKGLNTPENRKKAGKATLVAGGVALTVTGIYRMSQNEKVQAVAKEAARKTAEATKQTTDNAKNRVRSLKDKAGEAKKKLRSHRTTKAETSVGESEANKVNLQAQLSNEEEN
jgi:hypothetical protein